jgi:hypothetical protein
MRSMRRLAGIQSTLLAALFLGPPSPAQSGTAVYPGRFYSSGEHRPLDVAVGDVSGDGLPDVVVAHRGASFGGSWSVAVLEGNSLGGLEPPHVYLPAGVYGSSIALGDVTGDGRLDLVTAGGHRRDGVRGQRAGDAGRPRELPDERDRARAVPRAGGRERGRNRGRGRRRLLGHERRPRAEGQRRGHARPRGELRLRRHAPALRRRRRRDRRRPARRRDRQPHERDRHRSCRATRRGRWMRRSPIPRAAGSRRASRSAT